MLLSLILLVLPTTLQAEQGKIYIVGMGGSADLITLRGVETVTMNLVYPELFDQLKKHYPKIHQLLWCSTLETGKRKKVLRGTVGQARKEGTTTHQNFIKEQHGDDPWGK